MKKILVVALLAVPALALSAEENGILIPEGARLIPDRYIVMLKDEAVGPKTGLNVPILAVDMAARYGGTVTLMYEGTVQGFAIEMKESAAQKLAGDSRVALVEQDQVMAAVVTQNNATWGLDRIDQRALPLNTTYIHDRQGAGVTAFIIDTGIRKTHNDFGGRASAAGFTAINDGRGSTDCNGHGTHVAGTVGGSTYGVAKAVTLVAVRVLSCTGSGSNSGVIAGVNFAGNSSARPAVANMSLGGGASTALDNAVNAASGRGVTFAVAAGNSNANACNTSPARASSVITVASSTRTDARSSFSNFGSCVEIFAPGSSITSAWFSSNTATNTISGTSMASPHVAGAAALYLSGHTGASPSAVRSALVNNATLNRITNPGSGSPNRLLFSRVP